MSPRAYDIRKTSAADLIVMYVWVTPVDVHVVAGDGRTGGNCGGERWGSLGSTTGTAGAVYGAGV